MNAGSATASQLLKQATFIIIKPHWQHHFDSRKKVAASFATQVRHAFVGQPEQASILSLRWNGEHQFTPIWSYDRGFSPQNRGDEFNLYIAVEIVSPALVKLVWFNADHKEQIATRSSTASRF